MSKKRKWLALTMIMAMLLSAMTGCGPSQSADTDSDADSSSGEKKSISVIVMALNSDYWHMVEAGAKLAGNEFGYEVNVVGPNSESDSVAQSNMVEDAVTNHVGAIVLAPNEPKVLVSSVQKAKDAGVPVIIIDAALQTDDESLYESFIGTGNYEAGKTAGEYLASKLQKGDKVALIRGLVGQPTHDERANGAKDALEAAGMQIVAIQPADSDRGKAVNVAENIIQTTPDIKCFYATNDEMALGAYQAVEGSQLQKQVIVMGFDGSFGALDSIAEGKLSASLAQKPIEEGYLGVKAAIEVIEGKSVEKKVNNGVVIVDKDNVKSFREEIDAKVAESKKY
ncbi:sugar ABC transporter substrate-binding protein [Sinanaerobacter chloroacetimidivorans]|jgi:ribose transport system substrate-binding protein|uniref:Sugar ABC transporter substrate-binding protein n=1 Tax=Sinanaerobacter chloroacetimidivorans TaxID=2818044 RepID=A0A8J7W0A5_9FIRM|nr:sugar ABC transporter substrate-binding protein [Sinanaerobacter chloroacetimidivorans]MBR0596630.1 sugar ABC transporter substrate-binding protein [Sinanaerobacter chloroacetimidivorans]